MIEACWRLLELPLEFTFAISRGSKTVACTILVELSMKDLTGYGEAVPSRFYGEDADSVMAFYQKLLEDGFFQDISPENMQAFIEKLAIYPGNKAAKAGLDIAMHDLKAKQLQIPLYEMWGLDPARTPKTSYTLGIADLETLARKTHLAVERGYDVLKVKLGSNLKSLEQDLHAMEKIRQIAPDAVIRADANAGWSLAQALEMLPVLKEHGVEFVEEPLTLTSTPQEYARLKEESPLPLMADESCHILSDVPRCARYFHAVNLKHTKTGGLWESIRMIHAARAHGLKIMLGCFAESSVSITAFAHVSPLVDYADLDGSLLLAEDPFQGVSFSGSRMILPQRPGLGISPR